jgi:hypothetical protein
MIINILWKCFVNSFMMPILEVFPSSFNIFKYWFYEWCFSSLFFLTHDIYSSNVLKSCQILKEGILILPKTSKNLITFDKEIKESENKKEREVNNKKK